MQQQSKHQRKPPGGSERLPSTGDRLSLREQAIRSRPDTVLTSYRPASKARPARAWSGNATSLHGDPPAWQQLLTAWNANLAAREESLRIRQKEYRAWKANIETAEEVARRRDEEEELDDVADLDDEYF